MVGTQTRNCCRKRRSNDFYGICQEIAANKADIITRDLTNQKLAEIPDYLYYYYYYYKFFY